MKSNDIQNRLYWHLMKKSHKFICPNKYLDDWFECDMLSITSSDYLHEYEIKISRSDFKADFGKEAKHTVLESNIKKELLTEKKLLKLKCPSFFWYVTPVGLLTEKDIPEYAGWIEVPESKYPHSGIKVMIVAPRLNTNKVDDTCKLKILESMSHRYWQLKLKQGV